MARAWTGKTDVRAVGRSAERRARTSDAHRRAVALRAARAQHTVVAGCGIGTHAAGDAVTSASTGSLVEARRGDRANRGIAATLRGAREGISDKPDPPSEDHAFQDGARIVAPWTRQRTRWACGRRGRRWWRERARWSVAAARGICQSGCARYYEV